MGIALQNGWLVIISGPANSGKTSIVRIMAELTGNTLQEISINHATDTTDILGSYEQVDNNFRVLALAHRTLQLAENVSRTFDGSKSDTLLNLSRLKRAIANLPTVQSLPDLLQTTWNTVEALTGLGNSWAQEKVDLMEALRKEFAAVNTASRFEWIDGPLVRALKEGHWLLLDNANLCSPSVLDRLNSLCEPSGVLTLIERGLVDGITPTIAPHPNFRLVMCVDPQLGELSRAMRNRATEISLSLMRSQEDLRRLQDFHFLPPPLSDSDAGCITPLDFELVRRCLRSASSAAGPTTWLSSTALNSDSSAQAVVDRASLILPRDLSSLRPPSLAVLNFLVRSGTPAYANHLSRLISGLYSSDRSGPLRNLYLILDVARGDSIWHKLKEIQQYIWPNPSILGPPQSIDSFMKSATAPLSLTESHDITAQSTILRMYEMFVMTTCDDFGESSSPRLSMRNDRTAEDLSHVILTYTDGLATTINEHGVKLLQRTSKHLTREFSVKIHLIVNLLKYISFLRRKLRSAVDFSILQAVTSWIQDALQGAPVYLPDITQAAEILSRAVVSTTGLGLGDIWLSWTGSVTPNSYFRELELDVDDNGDGEKNRSQLLERIATKWLSTRTTFSTDVNASPLHQCTPHRTAVSKLAVPQTDKIFLIKELGTLAHIPDGDSLPILGQLIELASSDYRMPLQRFASYRHATLAAQFGMSGEPGVMLSIFESWLQALWSHGDSDGPSILFQPSELLGTVQACDWRNVTLQSVSDYREALEHHSRIFAVIGSRDSTRVEDLKALHRKALLLLASCFHRSFDDSTFNDLQEACHRSQSVSQLLSLLKRSSHVWFASSADRLVSGAVDEMSSDMSRAAALRTLGHDWIALSYFFMDLYIPDTPLDPAALQTARSEFWGAELASLSHELELEISLESRVTGNTYNGIADYLEEQIRHLRERLHNLPYASSKAGRDLSRLREFWSEISQFRLKFVSQTRLYHLIDAFYQKNQEASASEHVIQESISKLCQRLESIYPEFDDITRPFKSALLYLRLGLRLVAHASVCEGVEAIEDLSYALTAFPSVGGATALITADSRGDIRAVEGSPFESLLLTLTAISLEVELGIDAQSRIATIESIYERAIRLWLVDQKRQEEVDAASQSLYRANRIRNESELEEEDFLTLFPDYEALLGSDHLPESDPSDRVRRSFSADGSYSNSLMLLHLNIMNPGNQQSGAVTDLSNLRAVFLTSILGKYQSSLPEALDDRSFSHQVSLIAARLRDLDHSDMVARPYNFYIDSHVPQIRRAVTLVESLKQRLDVLIQEWPDQMVLHHLKDRCSQILALSARSPVAKVLVLLEQLLLESDDWEMYANQENTLKNQRHALTELIVSWRRLELSSWRGLLRLQAIAFEEGVSEWWFRLYNAIVRGLLDIVERSGSESLDDYLDHLVPLLDGFLTSSPLGQFSRRLELLRSFEPFLQLLTLTKSELAREPLCRVYRIVHSIQVYYSQFLSQITSSLVSQERGVETEIQGFIKIASWKDVNVQALKASAKKTHYQLYKLVRKYRDIMRQPVSDLLRPGQVSNIEILSKTGTPEPFLPSSSIIVDDSSLRDHVTTANGPAHLQDLRRTYRKFDLLITTRIEVFLKSLPYNELNNLTERIFYTDSELSSVSIPIGATTERREKLWKGLLVRKRKAWSDFVKEFKRIGLATNVPSTVLLRQNNDRWLREQPFPDVPDNSFADVQKSEQYFTRLQGLLPRLRATLIDHHGDVLTQELQRSIMLLESALSLTLGCRSMLATNLDKYARLKSISRRLHSLHQSSDISAWGPFMSDAIFGMEDLLSRMCHAISETMDKIKEFGNLPGASPAPVALLEGVQALLSSTQACRDPLRLIGNNLKETEPSILLRDEYDAAIFAQDHITKSKNVLLGWESDHPEFRLIISPLRGWLGSQTLGPLPGSPPPSESELDVSQVIEEVLKPIQSVLSIIPAESQIQDSSKDDYLKETSRSLIIIGDLLRLDSKVALFNSSVERLAGFPPEEVKKSISQLLPFLQRYTLLVEAQLAGMAKWRLMVSANRLRMIRGRPVQKTKVLVALGLVRAPGARM
ncbi:hypothetical protein B0F90DRAFT_1235505 [Multifurca ochricompacta]|uniref:ATPase dynein-related AAA domain-containing protein n=1 Tax=Multifurca ochricompacta TaxID=376703 RepID=A0AAD4M985_9AGAM|nr:hypothetical protein B0F90DRAFT_1235505 [Multifurca ochricompacta]